MAVELFIHKMSEHMETARIVQWLVHEGETVQRFQVLMEVETDKAVAELESPASGVLKGIRPGAMEGAEVKVGEVIAYIAAPDEPVPALPPVGSAEATDRNPFPHLKGEEAGIQPEHLPLGEGIRATPVARRLAKELSVELSAVKGSGPEGRIKEEDVRAYAESGAKTAQKPAAPASGVILPLTHNQRLTGQRMLESLQTAPQFSLTLSADMTQALQYRDTQAGQSTNPLKPSITAVLVEAVAGALKHYPRANAVFREDHLVLQPHINIGVALAGEGELVVPVISDADQLSLAQLARQIEIFQEKGKHMRFLPQDLSGGTFTVSNLGMYGIERFNAILVPGQSAILAAGKITKSPVAFEDGGIVLQPLLSLTQTVDHRVLDGVQAALFLNAIKQQLETLGSGG